MRVPISCVTGTSMGAIVGATFAAGRPPEEMEKIVLAADWDEIFRDQPPRAEIAVRRKMDDYKTLFAPEFGVKDGGLALPKGVIAGVSIESFFRDAFDAGLRHHRFPQASDPVPGDGHRHRDGPVGRARPRQPRAGDAREHVGPGAIAPMEIDGRLLVDGGIANNLPIDEARKLCADVVIAVNISTPPLKRERDHLRALRLAQLLNFLGKQTVDEQLKSMGDKDVLIAPDLGDISAATFERSEDAVRIGEEATRAIADKLRALQHAARAVRGVARNAGRRGEGARHGRRDPLRRAGAHESRSAARRWSRASPASRCPRRRSAPTCAASTGRAITRASATGSSGGTPARARW